MQICMCITSKIFSCPYAAIHKKKLRNSAWESIFVTWNFFDVKNFLSPFKNSRYTFPMAQALSRRDGQCPVEHSPWPRQWVDGTASVPLFSHGGPLGLDLENIFHLKIFIFRFSQGGAPLLDLENIFLSSQNFFFRFSQGGTPVLDLENIFHLKFLFFDFLRAEPPCWT